MDNENEYVVHINMNEKETETTRDTLEELINECPDEKSPVVMEYCVNREHEKINQSNLIKENDT